MDIEAIDKICRELPHVREEIKWKSDLVYMIAKKMFCVIDLDATPPSVAFKVQHDEFEDLSTEENFKPAPYFAQHKWVTVIDINKISEAVLSKHIKTSYDLVKAKLPKKALLDLG